MKRLFFCVLGLLLVAGCERTPRTAVPEQAAATVRPTNTAVAAPTNTPIPPPTAEPITEPPTPTPVPVDDTEPTAETEPTATTEPSPTPAPTATLGPRRQINGVPVSELVVLPPETVTHMREVYAQGQAQGRYTRVFSKLGDSVIANADFLNRFDTADAYTLAEYDYLQPTVDYFDGSWNRYGVAIRIGLRAWGVFDPMWADKDWCEPNETMIDCEFRLNNPSVVIIHLGTNDQSDNFPRFLRQTVQHSLDAGVIPVLMTKADRFEGEDNRNNIAIRAAAAEMNVPLIDFDAVADTLPNRGLRDDNIHLNGPLQHDYGQAESFEKGHTVQNLITLMMMDRLREEVISAEADG